MLEAMRNQDPCFTGTADGKADTRRRQPYQFDKDVWPGSKSSDDRLGDALYSIHDPVTGSGGALGYFGMGEVGEDLHGIDMGVSRTKLAGEYGGMHASLESSALNAKLVGGRGNPDGSKGVYMSGGYNILGGEASVGGSRSSGNELTVGGGLGLGFGIGVGVRDKNGDGSPEICGRLEMAALLGVDLGACVEASQVWGAPPMVESPEDAFREECIVGCHTGQDVDPMTAGRMGQGPSPLELAELDRERPDLTRPWVRPDSVGGRRGERSTPQR